MQHQNLSLYEMITQNFGGDMELYQVSDNDQVILSVLDNLQRILNCRAGTLSHLPDYGLPDMSQILQGMPGSAHSLMTTMTLVLMKYEPRLEGVAITLLPQRLSGQLEYSMEAELKGTGPFTFGTTFTPEGKILLRHLRQQRHLST
ncbi:type VI secretion system baseplate subunit TssE [Sodalis sp. dw_96]|uniref:type VI secretion system baseplate subunit TssE n=1 Tax=Sodalis sp. dw_96 TaxID=2719794 RepID=UPI001BD5B188|nr:type VI secretion system baseplate subunit TssE [Sodalis sp. dw_96]